MAEEPEQWRILDKCLETMEVIWQGDDTFNQLKEKKKKTWFVSDWTDSERQGALG